MSDVSPLLPLDCWDAVQGEFLTGLYIDSLPAAVQARYELNAHLRVQGDRFRVQVMGGGQILLNVTGRLHWTGTQVRLVPDQDAPHLLFEVTSVVDGNVWVRSLYDGWLVCWHRA